MDKAINSISLKLDDLQNRLHVYKMENEMILEDDNENTNRKGSTYRSGGENKNQIKANSRGDEPQVVEEDV